MTLPIILVPGLLCSAEVFAPQTAALWPYGPVTVAYTLAGETIDEIAASILRDAPPRFALAGISLGGYVGLEIMRQAPERVIRLALISTSARPDDPGQSDRHRAMLAQARANDFGAWTEEALTALAHPARQADATLRAVNRRMGLAVGIEGFARQTGAAISRPDSRPTLPQIRVPTIVLVGEDDKLIPLEHSQEIASQIPDADLVVIPRCGHSSSLEQPEFVSSALGAWINAGRPTSS